MNVDPTVIAEPAVFHWRDGVGKPLCDKAELETPHYIKYSNKDGRRECASCAGVVERMADGFDKEPNDRNNDPHGADMHPGGTLRLLEVEDTRLHTT